MFERKIVEPLPANTWDWFGASIFLKKSHTILKELQYRGTTTACRRDPTPIRQHRSQEWILSSKLLIHKPASPEQSVSFRLLHFFTMRQVSEDLPE